MKKLIVLMFACLLISSSLFAGPFGTEWYMSVDEVKKVGSLEFNEDGSFGNIDSYVFYPNKKNPNLTYYYAFFLDGKLESFSAATNPTEDDEKGNKVFKDYQTLLASLTRVYGDPLETFDTRQTKSTMGWLWDAFEGNGYLGRYWFIDNNLLITLEINPLSYSSGVVNLRYYTKDYYIAAMKLQDAAL